MVDHEDGTVGGRHEPGRRSDGPPSADERHGLVRQVESERTAHRRCAACRLRWRAAERWAPARTRRDPRLWSSARRGCLCTSPSVSSESERGPWRTRWRPYGIRKGVLGAVRLDGERRRGRDDIGEGPGEGDRLRASVCGRFEDDCAHIALDNLDETGSRRCSGLCASSGLAIASLEYRGVPAASTVFLLVRWQGLQGAVSVLVSLRAGRREWCRAKPRAGPRNRALIHTRLCASWRQAQQRETGSGGKRNKGVEGGADSDDQDEELRSLSLLCDRWSASTDTHLRSLSLLCDRGEQTAARSQDPCGPTTPCRYASDISLHEARAGC
jgi:hypothetical protein